MHSTYLFSAIALAGTSVLAQLRPAHKFVEIQDSLKDTCDEWEKACSKFVLTRLSETFCLNDWFLYSFDQDAGPVDSTCDTVVDIHQNGDCDNRLLDASY